MDNLAADMLAVIAELGPLKATGGAIWDRLDEVRELHHSSGEMYTVLHKLRDAGHLAPEKRGDKVYYSLTQAGRKALVSAEAARMKQAPLPA